VPNVEIIRVNNGAARASREACLQQVADPTIGETRSALPPRGSYRSNLTYHSNGKQTPTDNLRGPGKNVIIPVGSFGVVMIAKYEREIQGSTDKRSKHDPGSRPMEMEPL